MSACLSKSGDSEATRAFIARISKMVLQWHEDGITADEIQESLQPSLTFLAMMRENDSEDRELHRTSQEEVL